MTPSREAEIFAALDKIAIYELIARYARAVDRCDEELLRSVYHPDAMDYHGGIYEGGIDGYCKMAISLLKTMGPVAHYFTFPLVELDGDVATSESYGIGFHRIDREGDVFNCIAGARVLDRFERRNGVWKIACRRVVYDWNHDAPANETWGKGTFGVVKTESRKDRTDPVYEFAKR